MPKSKKKFFEIKMAKEENVADIYIYGAIAKYAWEEQGEVSSVTFRKELEGFGDVDVINLYINSPGGNIFETMAIIAQLQRTGAEIYSFIDGVAASAASVLPMISKKVYMPENAHMMIHSAESNASGNAAKLRKRADELDRISDSMTQFYLDRAGDKLTKERLDEMLKTDTWLTAAECLEYGLADEIIEANNAVAFAIDDEWAQRYPNAPKELLQNTAPQMTASEKAWREEELEKSKANLLYLKSIGL